MATFSGSNVQEESDLIYIDTTATMKYLTGNNVCSLRYQGYLNILNIIIIYLEEIIVFIKIISVMVMPLNR